MPSYENAAKAETKRPVTIAIIDDINRELEKYSYLTAKLSGSLDRLGNPTLEAKSPTSPEPAKEPYTVIEKLTVIQRGLMGLNSSLEQKLYSLEELVG